MTKVFVNNREIASAASDGKAVAAFPDVCFTPPQTPATPPGVPIPYPSTAMASDTSEGSKTVRVRNKPVMLRNKSCFGKSTGTEAGSAPKKGVVTSTNRGKLFFASWSMDMKVEGENVVRHLDITTLNHASMPGNTPTWPYLSKVAASGADKSHSCSDTTSKERNACAKTQAKVKAKAKAGKIPARSYNKALREAQCGNRDCRKARKCMLQPATPDKLDGQSGCCAGTTPHHVIPAHCFMPPGERAAGGPARLAGCGGYDIDKAPCICVSGKNKSAGMHKRIHDKFDKMENGFLDNGKAGTWTYEQASEAGAESVAQVTKCDKACIKAQVDAYHQNRRGQPKIRKDTKLRADSTGNRSREGTSARTGRGEL